MATGIARLDIPTILNLIKNDREFKITNGVPRDAYSKSVEYDVKNKVLTIWVESEGIEKDGDVIDIELYGNADAVDENGELKPLKPAIISKEL